METRLLGMHHVTAIVEDPQENIDFYTTLLGLRLVKQTVNFDDPYTYHLYYGDELGRPGTIVTFFPWMGARHGSRGVGQTSAMAFSVPADSLEYWATRLDEFEVRFGGPEQRFGEPVISFYDPSGLLLELVGQADTATSAAWSGGPVPVEYAIRGLHSVTLTVGQAEPSAQMLTDILGFRAVAVDGNRARYAIGAADVIGGLVDLVSRPDVPFGQMGSGTIHHVAWRVADDEQQQAWRERLLSAGAQVTPVRDRQYFRSIYFREPGGVLFELATDAPGFAFDEAPEQLGQMLKLPPWLEERRSNIESHLPPIQLREVRR